MKLLPTAPSQSLGGGLAAAPAVRFQLDVSAGAARNRVNDQLARRRATYKAY